jgi:ubiquinone/menaquinone biosynthesis C-methylase UbiE
MVVLDLGCGPGKPLKKFGVGDEDRVIGIDIDLGPCRVAKAAHPTRQILCARGEQLPLADNCLDQVVSDVAVPYMNIPVASKEIYRVLREGGRATVTLHPITFTLSELKQKRTLRAFIGRLTILANGVLLFLTGRVAHIPRCESFQTERGMRKALRQSGFREVSFSYTDRQMFATAKK